MHTAGHEFFAGATLTGDQHRRVRRVGNLVDPGLHVADHRRQPNQLGSGQLADPVLQPAQFVLQLTGLEHAAHRRQDAITRERLLDDVAGALAHRLDGLGDRAVASQDQNIR
jgi:hypothetical protein